MRIFLLRSLLVYVKKLFFKMSDLYFNVCVLPRDIGILYVFKCIRVFVRSRYIQLYAGFWW